MAGTTSFSAIKSVLRSKSLKYLLFRSKYELERRSGVLALRFPTGPKQRQLLSLDDWRGTDKYLFDGRDGVRVPVAPSVGLQDAVRRIENGEIRFFSDKWNQLGLDYDYVTNPLTGYRYDVNQHWTKINDYSKEAGDIKFVWEASRFCWLDTIVRNDYHNDEDHSGFVFERILDWIDKNPLNCGPNFKCSQEISLRVMNWLFALNFYKYSPALTDASWNRIIDSIYWQVHHVYDNISFSRIAVRNNHAITETLVLYLVGLMFPAFPDAEKWKKRGKRWFEEEIDYQFQSDGSYIQNSFNYQRVVTQLLTLGISLAHKNGERFSKRVYDRAYANEDFLYQCQDEKTGMLPNYGNNDGALFFPLSSADYCDFRPQLDALNYVLTGCPLYGRRLEESYWFGDTCTLNYPAIIKRYGIVEFAEGGYYVLRDEDATLFVRCGKFKGSCTPDLLHMDLWKDGEDLLMDAGSYLYNSDEATLRYFGGTEGHNTIMLGDMDQMKKGLHFVWTYPSDVVSAEAQEMADAYVLSFRIKSFKYVEGGYEVKRIIKKTKGKTELEVMDEVDPKSSLSLRQIWHTVSPEKLQFVSDGRREEKTGAFSRYYGRKEPLSQIEFLTTEGRITTSIRVSQ